MHAGQLYTGADGPYAADTLQYLAWARDSGSHVLAANRFDLAPAGHVFMHPLFGISGLLWKAGVSLQLAYLLWKPIAVAALGIATVLYARRMLPARRDAAFALA